jgi:hypothetical protein
MLGWAEDLINKLLEPLWNPVEAFLRRLFALVVPDFGLFDWARLPAIPDVPFVNLDHLVRGVSVIVSLPPRPRAPAQQYNEKSLLLHRFAP